MAHGNARSLRQGNTATMGSAGQKLLESLFRRETPWTMQGPSERVPESDGEARPRASQTCTRPPRGATVPSGLAGGVSKSRSLHRGPCPAPVQGHRVLWLPRRVLGEEAQKDGEAWTSCFPSGSVTSRWALTGVGWELGGGHPQVSGKGPHSLGGLLEEEVAASSQRGAWTWEGAH